MSNIIGLKELRQNMPAYAKKVEKGQSFVVVKQSKPLFKITPLEQESEEWEEVIDFTKIKRGGVKLDQLLSRL
ncbi:type II toxin-antitoxin system prevent-host-death family antitoxin [Patescibacteria group bacterium]|nr:type II toxin-antitoxin system prevent-host-death family antitoxin [Patescibacteria group bacterium]